MLSNRAGALPGQKFFSKKKKRDVNSDGVQVRPTRPDVYGPTDDAGFLTAEFQSGDPLGDDLDLQIVDRRPFEILPLGEPTKLKNSFKKSIKTMTMTMTHSEKSLIYQMKAWPYRQECRGHGPAKKNLFCWCNLLVWQVVQVQTVRGQIASQRYLRWTQCTRKRA